MKNESFIDRKERLKGEGKIELPLNIDTKKYLIWNISFQDLFILSPFIFLSLLAIFISYRLGYLSTQAIILSLAPTVTIAVFQLISHPVRKNVKLIKYGILWKFQYKKRKKEFVYKKGAIDMSNETEDIRTKFSLKNVFSGCYETTDNRFVKVLEVSPVNLSLMNNNERSLIYDSYRTFLSEMQLVKRLQTSVIAQPVNLSQYVLKIDNQIEQQKNPIKQKMGQSYKRYIDGIQKNKNMVSRKRYIIIDHPISSDREKALKEIEQKATIMKSKVEHMLTGYASLKANILNNDELTKLLYTCIDYDNAQALGDYIVGRANNKVSISLGEKTAKEIIDTYSSKLKNSIN